MADLEEHPQELDDDVLLAAMETTEENNRDIMTFLQKKQSVLTPQNRSTMEISWVNDSDIFAKNKRSLSYNPCEYCGKNFTQEHSLVEHQKYACKKLSTQPRPKMTCPNCKKQRSKTTVYKHLNNGCPGDVRVVETDPYGYSWF